MKVFSSLLLIAALSVIPVLHPVAALALPNAQGQNNAANLPAAHRDEVEARGHAPFLSSAIAAMNSGDKADKEKNADDPRDDCVA